MLSSRSESVEEYAADRLGFFAVSQYFPIACGEVQWDFDSGFRPIGRLHRTVGVFGVVAAARERDDFVMQRREVTDGIGRRRVPGQRQCLAATAAEILLATRAAPAWLLHPGGA